MTTIPQILKDCAPHMDKAIDSSKREFAVDPLGQGVAQHARHGARRGRTGR